MTQLLESKLALDINPAKIVQLAGQIARVTWAGAGDGTVTVSGFDSTVAEYWRLLKNRQFSALLNDGGMLQCSIDYSRDEVVGHRFVFVPCPVIIRDLWAPASVESEPGNEPPAESTSANPAADRESGRDGRVDTADHDVEGEEDALAAIAGDLAADAGYDLQDVLWLALTSELDPAAQCLDGNNPNGAITSVAVPPRLRLRPTLRFDYDPTRAEARHPGAHVHCADEDVRWPVFGPLSLGHFVHFIFRHFYPEWWDAHSFLREWPTMRGTRCVTEDDENGLFFECRR